MDADYVWVDPALGSLALVMRSWQLECARYSSVMNNNDVCWWFNERASTSTLAISAARLAGWIALEEFSNTKGRITETGARRHSRGRCDLYLANRKTDYAVEIKQAWQPLFSQKDPLSVARGYWSKAWTDAGALYRDEAEFRLAGLFVVPHHRSSDHQAADERLLLFVEALRTLPNIGALALWFPRSERKRRAESGRFFPGVALALRRRLKSTRTTNRRDSSQ